jgi:hypothetical protein
MMTNKSSGQKLRSLSSLATQLAPDFKYAPPLPSPEHGEGAEEGGKAEEKKKRVTIMEVDDE